MRIVSLSPAATEWIVASGGARYVVGRSHRCSAAGLQHAAVSSAQATAAHTNEPPDDDPFRAEIRSIRPDIAVIRTLAPDLVVVGDASQADALAAEGRHPAILVFAPATFKEILDGALTLGVRCGTSAAAMHLLAGLERDLLRARTATGLDKRKEGRLKVAIVHGTPRLYAGGYWCEDLIELAGGRAVLAGRHGLPPRPVSLDELEAALPDAIVDATGGTVDAESHPGLGRAHVSIIRLPSNLPLYRPSPDIYRTVFHLIAAFAGRTDAGYVDDEDKVK